MTVSKTTTQDEIRNLLTLGAGGGVCGDYYDVVERLAKFCDSLTAELQKENARLREALEESRGIIDKARRLTASDPDSTYCRQATLLLNYGITGNACGAALSKEKE